MARRGLKLWRQAGSRNKLCSHKDYQWQNYLDFSSPQQRNKLLGIIHQHLAAGGHLLFDVFSLSAYRERKEGALCEPWLMEGFWSADDYFGFLQTCKYEDEQVVLDKYSIFEAEHSFEVYNWLQYFTRDKIMEAQNFTSVVCRWLIGMRMSRAALLTRMQRKLLLLQKKNNETASFE